MLKRMIRLEAWDIESFHSGSTYRVMISGIWSSHAQRGMKASLKCAVHPERATMLGGMQR